MIIDSFAENNINQFLFTKYMLSGDAPNSSAGGVTATADYTKGPADFIRRGLLMFSVNAFGGFPMTGFPPSAV
jgi:hypothetical protein